VSDRVLVMYLGQVVEIGPVEAIYGRAKHPYTLALLNSRLSINPDDRIDEAPLTGEPPNPIKHPSGCRFRMRCPYAQAVCAARTPAIGNWIDRSSHLAACHMLDASSGHTRAGHLQAGVAANPAIAAAANL
jgi:peptide/nickel transport system ATP-binding protein